MDILTIAERKLGKISQFCRIWEITMCSGDPKEASSSVTSIISPDFKIVGHVKSNSAIQIDGTIEGDIDVPLLTVGEQGKVDGSAVAETVRIFGTVNGRVQAKTVSLAESAKVTADITCESLAIEAGAYFEGQVQSVKGASSTGSAKLPWAGRRSRSPAGSG